MATYRGMDGSLTFSGGAVGEVKSWQATIDVEELEDTSLGENWRGFVGGLGAWQGTLTANLDYGDTNQAAMIDTVVNATPASVATAAELLISGSTKKITGSILLRQIQLDLSLGNIVALSAQFRGIGAPAIAWT